jgi:hypothetical protein
VIHTIISLLKRHPNPNRTFVAWKVGRDSGIAGFRNAELAADFMRRVRINKGTAKLSTQDAYIAAVRS